MNNLVARQEPSKPFIFLPRKESNFPKETSDQRFPQFIPMPYPVPMGGNQDNNQGGFNSGRALGAMAGYLGMGFGDPAFSPGPMLAGRYGDLLAKSPSFEIPGGQGRNPDYSIYNDPRMPGARNLRRKLEGILGLPRIEFPKV